MTQFNYFKNLCKYGNNLFGLIFVIPLVFHTGVLMTPTESYAETTEKRFPYFQSPSIFASAKQNPTKPTISENDLLKELRDRVRRDLLASGTNTEAVVDQTLDSLPIDELTNYAFFFDGQNLKVGTIGSLGISQHSIARTYSQYIEPISVELEFKIEKIKGGYGGENLYKIRNDEGVEFYLSLIGFGSFNSQTFVVLWEKDPRGL